MPDQSIKLKHFEDIPNLYYVFEKPKLTKLIFVSNASPG